MTARAPEPSLAELEMIRGTRAVLDLLRGKWSVEVLTLLSGGPCRYCELLYEVGEVSKKMLTQTLRTLEAHRLVERRVGAGAAPRVAYALTPLGAEVTAPLRAMHAWSAAHLDDEAGAPRAMAA